MIKRKQRRNQLTIPRASHASHVYTCRAKPETQEPNSVNIESASSVSFANRTRDRSLQP